MKPVECDVYLCCRDGEDRGMASEVAAGLARFGFRVCVSERDAPSALQPERSASIEQSPDFVKPGVGVEVHYKDVGGTLMATDVHSGLPPISGEARAESAGGSARCAVSAVSGSSVTLKSADQEWVVTVDAKTMVVGEGLGTITRQFKEQGKAPTVADLVAVNDQVIVYFKDAAGSKRASEIRVLRKAAK